MEIGKWRDNRQFILKVVSELYSKDKINSYKIVLNYVITIKLKT